MKKDKDITPGSSTTAAAAEDEPVYDADGNIDTTGMTKAEIRKMEKKQEKAELRQVPCPLPRLRGACCLILLLPVRSTTERRV